MSHRVGELAEKLDKVRDIAAICLFVAMAVVCKYSQTMAEAVGIKEEQKVETIKIEKIEQTSQEKIVLAPAAVKIPVAMTEEEEDTEESTAMDIEQASFDADTPPPPPPPPPPKGGETEEEAIDIWVVSEQPTLVGGDQALYSNLVYPPGAKRMGMSGKVTLKFEVSKDGVPEKIAVLMEKPKDMGFGDAARTALSKVRFKPGMQGDKPVKVRMSLPINFNIKK